MGWASSAKRRRFLKAAVVARDGTRCHWCHVETEDCRMARPTQRTIDHVKARSIGGSSDLSNLVVACLECNGKRGQQNGSPGLISEAQLLELMSAK